MSTDTVDDLQAAEDHIASLHAAAQAVIDVVVGTEGDPSDSVDWQDLTDAVTRLHQHTVIAWCRPSCQAGDCDDDCGCLAHEDDEDHHPPDAD